MIRIILTLGLLISFNVSAQSNVLDDILGRNEVGESCRSDYECNSFCCDSSAGMCARHDADVKCDKKTGEKCIASEFCEPSYVTVCKIYMTHPMPDGSPACVLRCPSVLISGDCINGSCKPPVAPPVPVFNPNDCSQAI